jgi:uncharacterized protein YhaN
MKITNIEIEGFGIWSGLKVERLSDALNVVYGPNEAGKTTLLEFVRTMFYGFSPGRRRYVPPVHGGRAGGALDVSSPHGQFQIRRHDAADDATGGEQLLLVAADGTRQGEHFVKVLLANVDEAVFNNVFAVGLREVQELAALSDTEAAELLYSLTAGLDRVSLVEVLRELESSRNRLLDAAGRPCQIGQLLAEREKLRAEIDELGAINHRFYQLAAERDQLHAEVTLLEEEANRIERLARTADLAAAVRDRWTQREALDEQLATLGPMKVMPERAVERLDALTARVQKHQERLDRFVRRRGELRREFADLKLNDSLWRQSARIAALREQEPWIAQLQRQIGDLEKEIADLSSELVAEGQRLGLDAAAATPDLSSKKLASLRPPARLLSESHARWKEAKQAVQMARQSAESLGGQIESALASRGGAELGAALDQAGELVSQLRRRLQVDERLDQLGRHQTQLEEQARHWDDRQLLPVGVLIALALVFGIGAMLVLAGLFMPASIVGAAGWTLAILGLSGFGVAAVGKVTIERWRTRRLDACRKQLETLQLQVQQTQEERGTLDARLPRGGGPVASRLQAAEADLASLEELGPLEAQRGTARHEADAATRRMAEAQETLHAARRRWREALAAAGLPETLTSSQARGLMRHGDRIGEMQRRIVQRQEEIARRRAELDAIAARWAQLAADAGVPLQSTNLTDQLVELSEAATRQEAVAERREAIRREGRRLRTAADKHDDAVGRLKHRRRGLLIEAGVKDEQEFRQRALDCARAEVLRGQREALAQEIAAVLGSQCSEDAIGQLLAAADRAQLEARAAELRRRFSEVQEQLRGLLEKRGRLSEQIESLTADRRPASKQLDLAVLEKRLADEVRRWQVLAAACDMLDAIREDYQLHRQPETLLEASGYLDRLTQGHYRRVWTPLGERSLRVDDAAGRCLPVESLSRGTREQLFLSLRLALAAGYARRGAPLPLVLDDVLVNFDAQRAKAAAAVLRDFAAAGHQILVFTCHEHLHQLFKSLRVPVSRLPDHAATGPLVVAWESCEEEKPKQQQRRPRAPRRKREEPPPEVAGNVDEPPEESDDVGVPLADQSLWEGEGDGDFDEFAGGSAAA